MMLPAISEVMKPSASRIIDDVTFLMSSSHRAGNTANTFSGLGMSTGCVSFRSVDTVSQTMSSKNTTITMWHVERFRPPAK